MAQRQVTTVSKTTAGASNRVEINNVLPGNLLVLAVSWAQITNSNAPTVAGWSIAENPAGQIFLGSAWTGSAIFYKYAATTTEVAVVVPGASSTSCALTAVIAEYDTSLTTEPLDVHTSGGGTSGTSGNSGTTGATAEAVELVVVALGLADAAGSPHAALGISDPASTGYGTTAVNQNTTDSSIGLQVSYKYTSATGTQTASWTWTDSSAYVGTIAVFKIAPRLPAGERAARKKRAPRRPYDIKGWFNTRSHDKGWFWREWPATASSNVTLALTGQSATASAGTLAPSDSVALTGQAVTASAGTLAVSVALTGQAITSAAGTLVANNSHALTTQAVTASAGTLVANDTIALTGQSVTLSQGTVTPGLTILVALTGQSITSAQGTLVANDSIALTGQSVTASLGTTVANTSIALTGQSVTASQGTLTPSVGITLALTGQTITASAGNAVAANACALTGQSINAAQGSTGITLAVPLTGQSVSSAQGTLTPVVIAGTVVALTGQSVTLSAGTIVLPLFATFAPKHYSATPRARRLGPVEDRIPVARLGVEVDPVDEGRLGLVSDYVNEGRLGSPVRVIDVHAPPPAPVLVSVVSRKTHGSAGDFDITLDMTAAIGGAITVEPRDNSVAHRIVFTFDRAIDNPGTPTSVDSTAAAFGTPSAVAAGSTVIVSITGAPNKKRAVISLAGVNGLTSASINAGFLIGDTSNNRVVNISDLNAISVRNGQAVTTANRQYDIDLDGTVTTALDRAMASLHTGETI